MQEALEKIQQAELANELKMTQLEEELKRLEQDQEKALENLKKEVLAVEQAEKSKLSAELETILDQEKALMAEKLLKQKAFYQATYERKEMLFVNQIIERVKIRYGS